MIEGDRFEMDLLAQLVGQGITFLGFAVIVAGS